MFTNGVFVRFIYCLTLTYPWLKWTVQGLPFYDQRTPEKESDAEKIFYRAELTSIFTERLKLATKLVDEVYGTPYDIEDLVNDIREKEFRVEIKFTGDGFVDESRTDDDDVIVITEHASSHHRHHKQDRLWHHLTKFLIKTHRKGLSQNETETILDAIFAAPWADDDVANFKTCYMNCGNLCRLPLSPPPPTIAPDMTQVQVQLDQPLYSGTHLGHGDDRLPCHTDTDRLWFCAHSCMNMALGRFLSDAAHVWGELNPLKIPLFSTRSETQEGMWHNEKYFPQQNFL